MIAILLCCVALVATYFSARRSLGAGLLAVTLTGYLYGVLRANFTTAASHFIFDASLMGIYIAFGSQFFTDTDQDKSSILRTWVVILIAVPTLICLLPFQPLMVSIVGLRGNIFFLPMLVIGARLKNADLRQLALGLAVLNVGSLCVGVVEYRNGIEMFFPKSAVTAIMYASGDVAGGHYRIPSLFTSAHAYAGTMVCTLPFLFGAWVQTAGHGLRKLVLLLGMAAALCGVLLASTRTFFAIAVYMVVVATFAIKVRTMKRLIWLMIILVAGFMALTNERFQRFKSLGDSELVMERIAGSVNRSFLEVLVEYPMGNGLGGGGTSMPYFLEGKIVNPIAIESEYGRILAEQGIIGLTVWVSFILWCVVRRTAFVKHPWFQSRRLIWYWAVVTFANACLGIGMLTAIPTTFFFLLAVGWIVVVPQTEMVAPARRASWVSGAPYRPAGRVLAGR